MIKDLEIKLKIKLLELKSNFKARIKSFIDQKYFDERVTFQSKSYTKKINYSVCFWGDRYLNMVTDILIPSLNQPNNVKLLNELGYDQTLYLYCPENFSKERLLEFEHFKSINNSIDIKVEHFKIDMVERYEKYILRNNLIDFIQKSIDADAISSVLTADHIIGDKSLYNMVQIIDKDDICLASIQPRVNFNEFYDYFSVFFKNEENVLSNRFLVKKSIEHLHKSWSCFLNFDEKLPLGNHLLKINDNVYQARSSRVNVALQGLIFLTLSFSKILITIIGLISFGQEN